MTKHYYLLEPIGFSSALNKHIIRFRNMSNRIELVEENMVMPTAVYSVVNQKFLSTLILMKKL